MVKIRFYDPGADGKLHPKKTTASSGGITLNWIAALGWKANPFTIRTIPTYRYFVGQEAARQAINLFFIRERRFGTIRGASGSGKTMLLQWTAEELAPYADKYDVHLLDASRPLPEQLLSLTDRYQGLFAKFKGHSPSDVIQFLKARTKRKLVLLVDNADNLGSLGAYIHALFDDLEAVVLLAGKNPESFAEDLLHIELAPLQPSHAIQLLERRIAHVGGKGIAPFTVGELEEWWPQANANVASYLHKVQEHAVHKALGPKEQTQQSGEQPAQKAGSQRFDDALKDLLN